MANSHLTYFIFFVLLTIVHSQIHQCNGTHLEFFSQYYLGRQDELNKTFTKIGQKILDLNNVAWKANTSTTYQIKGVKPVFVYLDSKQRAEITGNDTVVIDKGRVQVRFDFQWTRQDFTSTLSGNGSALALSDEIIFAFQLKIKDGFLLEQLTHYEQVRFNQFGINISRINPPSTSEEDLKNLRRLLNDIINVTTVKHELEDQIDKYFHYYLYQSLYDDRRIIDEHYQYQWNGPKGKFVIPYSINALFVDVQKAGITLEYKASIKDYPGWTCQNWAPTLILNPAVYGGVQEFITFDVYRNTLKYAIDNGQLDAALDRRNWESRLFQFYAGDLYEVIPKVSQRFLASQPVTGECKTSSRYVTMKKGGYDYFNVSFVYNCQLGVNRDKVTQFQINLTLAVEGRPNETNIDFHVLNHTHTATLIPYMDYQIQNPTLGQHMITHSLNRLIGHKTFGSGWKLYTRDYPHFIVEDNYTIVYDSTHVDPHLTKLSQS